MLSESASQEQVRAAIARAAQHLRRNPDDADARAQLDALRTEYRTRQLAAYINQIVASAPPLSTEQRSRLALLLHNEQAA